MIPVWAQLAYLVSAVCFILDAPAMTGQMIALDGGRHLGWSHPIEHEPEDHSPIDEVRLSKSRLESWLKAH